MKTMFALLVPLALAAAPASADLCRDAKGAIAQCASAATAASDKAMIQALDDQFGARANAGDAAGVGAMYSERGVILPPNMPRIDGRAAIQRYWAQAIPAVTEVKLTADQVRRLAPDMIEEIGHYAMRSKAAPAVTLQGKYVVIWRREGGSWKLGTDIWN